MQDQTTARVTDLIGREIGYVGGSALNYREIPDALSAKRPFQGSSMSAYTQADGSYVVLSYATVIAVWTPGESATVIDRNRWGQTTGRHINLCRAWL